MTTVPAMAMPAAQLPRMILYWLRMAQSLNFSLLSKASHLLSDAFSSRSSTALPAPVHVDLSNSTPRRSAWMAKAGPTTKMTPRALSWMGSARKAGQRRWR